MIKTIRFTTLLIFLWLLAGCNFDTSEATPTAEVIIQPTDTIPVATVTPQPTMIPVASSSPLPTEPAEIQISTPSPTPTLFPSDTPIPTETPGHWEYVIQQGDSLYYIIQQPPFNYDNYDVVNEIIHINDNMNNVDSLPAPGSTILIPRPTASPPPQPGDDTTTSINPSTHRFPENTTFGCHTVQEQETLIGIAEQYGVTLEILSQLNSDIDWGGCNFENPSGGENCNPFISIDQCISVPFPTPTPTLTPTPSGNETPTATPTFAAPRLIFPPQNSIVPPRIINLQWVSVGVLQPEEYYLIQVVDVTAGTQPWRNITQSTSTTLPDTLIPADGQSHIMEWVIVVVKADDQGLYSPVGGTSSTQTFQWQSR
jgi:hypothetical protein